MKIEVGVGGSGLWNKDEKNMVVEVLGVNAFDYLVTNSVSNENLLMVIEKMYTSKKKISKYNGAEPTQFENNQS
jgi:2-keto-3-deoxy-L-rhamnonate aldolase RhmA